MAGDRVQAERTRRNPRQLPDLFEGVYNSVHDAIFIHDATGALIDVNQTMLDLYGLESREKALKLSITDDYSGPEAPVAHLPSLWKAALEGEPQLFEWQARRPGDGSVFEAEVFLARINHDDQVILLATVRDISTKNREKRLLESIFQGSSVGMYVLQDEQILLANRRLEEYLGYSSRELQSMHPLDLVVCEDRELVQEGRQSMMAGQRGTPFQYRILSRRGQIRWMRESVTAINYGEREAVLGSVYDVTEHKKNEEQLQYLSFHDKLTGLYNRAFFELELIRHDTPRQLPLSVIIADVNGLKLVNDIMGHHTGDRTIVETARLLRETCRQEDIVCRWGGDEFAILLPRTAAWAAEEICHRIKKACVERSNDGLTLSLALGVATKEEALLDSRAAAQDVQELWPRAESCMYRQKLLDSQNAGSLIPEFVRVALVEKTQETHEHLEKLKEYCQQMGAALELSGEEMERLILLSELHDVGKIAIPDSVLSKPGKLNAEEWRLVKQHPEIGARIVRSIPNLSRVAAEIRAHHERWDGKGYPDGLQGAKIPLLSRILAIADAYDVMTRGRTYQAAVSPEDAREELGQCAGSQFDPHLVKLFGASVLEREP